MTNDYIIGKIYLHLANAFVQGDFQWFIHIHTPTAVSTMQGDCSSGAVRVRHLSQGHLDTGGAGDRTSNLPVTSQPALPPELQNRDPISQKAYFIWNVLVGFSLLPPPPLLRYAPQSPADEQTGVQEEVRLQHSEGGLPAGPPRAHQGVPLLHSPARIPGSCALKRSRLGGSLLSYGGAGDCWLVSYMSSYLMILFFYKNVCSIKGPFISSDLHKLMIQSHKQTAIYTTGYDCMTGRC